VGAFHPAYAFCDLDMHHGRHGIGIVVGRALDIDDAGQHSRIGVEQSRAAVGAKLPAAMFGRFLDLGRSLRHLERILGIHRPTDHRRAGVTPAIRAVTQRMTDRFAIDLIADRAAMTAAGDVDHVRSPIDVLVALRLALAQLRLICEPVSWRVD
jgi:hypothetical protein